MLPTVGSDLSKGWLGLAVHPTKVQFRVANDAAGWRELCRRLAAIAPRAIGVEASGGYERGLTHALLAADLPVRMVNARKPPQFAKAAGLPAQNNRVDAYAT